MISPGDLSLREAFGEELCALAGRDNRILVLDGDVASSTRADIFATRFPDRFLEMGIAEQNMVGVAAGLATVGLRPWLSAFATFLSTRVLDQVSISVVQPHLPVVLAGAYAGLLNGRNGKTHHSLIDIAIMRSLPGMTVVSPCDAGEVRRAMRAIAQLDGPAYLRLSRDPSPTILPEDATFRLGSPTILLDHPHPDVTLVSTGVQSGRTLDAARRLARTIAARVVHLPTLAPVDVDAVLDALGDAPLIVTVEDHSRTGGLGGLICESTAEVQPRKVIRLGLDDYGESAENDALLAAYGLSSARVAQRVAEIVDIVRRELTRVEA